MTKPLLEVLAGRRRDPPPIWLMRQAGRYLPEYRELRARAGSFLDLCFDPARAAEVTLQPVRRFDLDAAILFADILLIPRALGRDLDFVAGEGPRLTPLREPAEIAALTPAAAVEALAPIAETVRRVAAALPESAALIGFAGAPWTVAAYMIEGGGSRSFEAARRFTLSEPAAAERLLSLLAEVTADYLGAQIEAGAEVVKIFDSWAGLVPEADFERLVTGPTARLVAALRARHPGVPVIGFARGAGPHLERYLDATGVDGLALDETVPLDHARRLQEAVPVQGNLDPVRLLAGGPALTEAARRLCAELAGGPHIAGLGHGVIKHTPPAHVAQLVAAVRAGDVSRPGASLT